MNMNNEEVDMVDWETAFTALRGMWKRIIQHAIDGKAQFQKEADTCMRFFDGPYDFMYDGRNKHFLFQGQGQMPKPAIAMTVNKASELVQLFAPSFYHTNPTRTVSARQFPKLPAELFGDQNDPQNQQRMMPILQQLHQSSMTDKVRAVLIESVLNQLPVDNDLKTESCCAIDQSLVTGVGLLWTETKRMLGSDRKIIRSVYDSQDNWLMDPDQDRMSDAKFCFRRCVKPVWEVEAEYGHEPGSLKGNASSAENEAAYAATGNEYLRRTGKSNDLMVYWKIYSKMGMGSLLKGISKDAAAADKFGRFVHIVVSDNYKFLINCPKSIWNNEEEMVRRLQWETPFWANDSSTNGWPFSPLIYHKVPNKLYPMSHLKPALGELQFINWAYSFLISKIERVSRDFIACAKASGEELKEKIRSGSDLTFLEVEHTLGKNINEVISFLQHPPFHADIYKIIQAVEKNFEQRTGLSELMYGATASAFRSAEEANVKQTQMQIRPDDMANKTEDWQGEVARKEALALRFHCDGATDIAPFFGPFFGQLWDEYVASADIDEIAHQLEYRIEEGTMKKPNKQRDQDNAQKAMQALLPVAVPFAQNGDVDPLNALIETFGDAIGMDVGKMKIKPPPPPPQPANPAAQQMQDQQHAENEHQQGQRHAQEKHDLTIKLQKKKAAAAATAAKNGQSA